MKVKHKRKKLIKGLRCKEHDKIVGDLLYRLDAACVKALKETARGALIFETGVAKEALEAVELSVKQLTNEEKQASDDIRSAAGRIILAMDANDAMRKKKYSDKGEEENCEAVFEEE